MRLRLWTARVALVGLLAGTACGVRWVLELPSPVLPVLAALFVLGTQLWTAAQLLGDAARGCPAVSTLFCSVVPTMVAAWLTVESGQARLLPIVMATVVIWTGAVHQLAAHAVTVRGEGR